MADNAYDSNAGSQQTTAYTPVAGGASDSPFSFGGDPNAPGMFGMSRGFWRDVASWSANLGVAANARTAGGFLANGTGFLGPVAAATQETLAQGVKNATAQAALNQSGATTVDLKSQAAQRNIQNKVNLFNLNRSSWLYGGPQFDENGNPLKPGQTSPYAPFQDNGQTPPETPQSQSSVTLPSAVTPQSAAPNQNYAGLYGNPTEPDWAPKNLTTVTTPSGAKFTVNKTAAPAFQGFLGELEQQGYKINPSTSGGYNLRNVTGGTTLSPHAYGVAIDVNPPENPYSKTPEGGALTTNLPPNVSQLAAKYGLQWGGDWKSLKDPMHFEYVGGKPVQVAQAGNVATDATPTPGAPTSLAPPATGTPAPAPSAAATQISQPEALRLSRDVLTGRKSLSSLTPQQAGAIAPMITMVDKDLGAKLSTFALAGPQKQAETAAVVPEGFTQTPHGLVPTPNGPHDPAMLAAQKAAETKAQAENENVTIRGPGSASIGPRGIVQSPDVYEVLGPDLRKWRITQNAVDTGQPYVRPSGVPDWAPNGTLSAVPAELSPGEAEAQKAAGEDAFGEKARAQYASALGTKRSMEDMESQIDILNKGNPNWYNTGAGGETKLQIGKAANAALASIGLPAWYDPVKLAAGEDLMKQTKLAGLTVLNTLQGAQREAAQIITSTQSAVPNIENTPQGAKLVLHGIREAANWTADQHTFMTNWYNAHQGNMVGADVAFNQERPSQLYARRGISMVRPYAVSDPSDFKRYLPGTQVYLKGTDPRDPNNIKTVPGDEDLQYKIPSHKGSQ